jgi:Bacterial TSP3 repeat
MSRLTIMKKSRVLAAATAIGAAGFLTVSPPAQADPMLPLAPACDQYGFPDDYFDLTTTKDYYVSVQSKGTTLGPGAVTAFKFTGTNGVYGDASGGITGANSFDLNVNWDDGAPGQYVGVIDDNGFVHGYVLNGGADWKSDEPLKCTTSPPTTDPAPPGPGGREDRDGDGLFDDDEMTVYGTNPDVADTDGDGPDDGQEVFDGTNPNDPNNP